MDKATLRRIIREEVVRLLEAEEAAAPKVEFPDWLENKIKTVHSTPGQGSIFDDPGKVKDEVMKLVDKKSDEIDSIAKGPGTLTAEISGIGYDLVLPVEEAEKLPDAEMGETEKVEGPNRVKVPMVKTSAPLSDFKTNQLTVIVRPKKDTSAQILPGEYIILSAFPGKDLPRASEWAGKYAVVVPESRVGSKAESSRRTGEVILERWHRLAGIK